MENESNDPNKSSRPRPDKAEQPFHFDLATWLPLRYLDTWTTTPPALCLRFGCRAAQHDAMIISRNRRYLEFWFAGFVVLGFLGCSWVSGPLSLSSVVARLVRRVAWAVLSPEFPLFTISSTCTPYRSRAKLQDKEAWTLPSFTRSWHTIYSESNTRTRKGCLFWSLLSLLVLFAPPNPRCPIRPIRLCRFLSLRPT